MTPLDDATAFFIDAIERPTGGRIVPFEPWHIPALVQREHEATSFAALGGLDQTAALCDAAEYASLALELLTNSYINGESVRIDTGTRMQPK